MCRYANTFDEPHPIPFPSHPWNKLTSKRELWCMREIRKESRRDKNIWSLHTHEFTLEAQLIVLCSCK